MGRSKDKPPGRDHALNVKPSHQLRKAKGSEDLIVL